MKVVGFINLMNIHGSLSLTVTKTIVIIRVVCKCTI